jgi:hypothetical protein
MFRARAFIQRPTFGTITDWPMDSTVTPRNRARHDMASLRAGADADAVEPQPDATPPDTSNPNPDGSVPVSAAGRLAPVVARRGDCALKLVDYGPRKMFHGMPIV